MVVDVEAMKEVEAGVFVQMSYLARLLREHVNAREWHRVETLTLSVRATPGVTNSTHTLTRDYLIIIELTNYMLIVVKVLDLEEET